MTFAKCAAGPAWHDAVAKVSPFMHEPRRLSCDHEDGVEATRHRVDAIAATKYIFCSESSPASCISVFNAILPEPVCRGSQSDVKFVDEGRSEWSRRTYAQRGQWQNPLLYLFGRSSKSKVIVLPLYRIPIRAKDRPQASRALPKGK